MSKLAIEKYPDATQTAWTLSGDAKQLLEKIQRRAHNLFLKRGGGDGSHLDDWFRAERETIEVPAGELVESDGQFELRLAAPGFEAKQVKVVAMPGEVVLRAEASEQRGATQGVVHFSEFSRKEIFRRVALPAEIDVDKVQAKLENGVVAITMPKKVATPVKAPKKKAISSKKTGAAKKSMAKKAADDKARPKKQTAARSGG